MLLSTTQELSGELSNEVSRATAAVTAVVLLAAAAHERVHREALSHCQPTQTH